MDRKFIKKYHIQFMNSKQYSQYVGMLQKRNELYDKYGHISEKAFNFPYIIIGLFPGDMEKEAEVIRDLLLDVITMELPLIEQGNVKTHLNLF